MSARKKSEASAATPGKKRQSPKAKTGAGETSASEKIKARESAFPIVGIGASAGGLEALGQFLKNMPSGTNMAFLLVQHLAPDKSSYMSELLGKKTSMPVMVMEDGMKIEPGHVYCNPPGKTVDIFQAAFRLIDQPKLKGLGYPIDRFLRSLAMDREKNAIAVILSGTGSDGSQGIREIKARGGMVMVQDPSRAEYDGMPNNAIDTGVADYVLPAEKMPEQLIEYTRHPYLSALEKSEVEDLATTDHIQKILMLVRSRTGHDFSQYKSNTIHRRIQRRMAVHKIGKSADYARFLKQNPYEVDKLFQEMLIRVSSFFRDKEVFESLAEKVVSDLIREKEPFSSLRVWVPGCSTGEEAYTLAILLAEGLAKIKKEIKIQIFASDIDHEAINFARAAQYSSGIREDVSPERLDRFFIQKDDLYQVKREIRETVIFAVQNLTSDPPYSKLDLISCRNLLIYLSPILQKKFSRCSITS